MKEFKTLKLKGFITLQNILFVKKKLKNEGMASFDKNISTIHNYTLPKYKISL